MLHRIVSLLHVSYYSNVQYKLKILVWLVLQYSILSIWANILFWLPLQFRDAFRLLGVLFDVAARVGSVIRRSPSLWSSSLFFFFKGDVSILVVMARDSITLVGPRGLSAEREEKESDEKEQRNRKRKKKPQSAGTSGNVPDVYPRRMSCSKLLSGPWKEREFCLFLTSNASRSPCSWHAVMHNSMTIRFLLRMRETHQSVLPKLQSQS